MQQVILDQIVAYPNFHPNNELNSSDTIIAKCVERVKHEGNSHLLDVQDLPAIVEGQKRRLEIMLSGHACVRLSTRAVRCTVSRS